MFESLRISAIYLFSIEAIWGWIISGGLALYLFDKFWKSREKRGDEIEQLKKRLIILEGNFKNMPVIIENIIHKELKGVEENISRNIEKNHEHELRNLHNLKVMVEDILDKKHEEITKTGELYLSKIKKNERVSKKNPRR